MVIVPVFTISANAELEELPADEDEDEVEGEDDPPEPPMLPALAVPPAEPPPPLDEDELDDELLPAALAVEPADTESPGSRLAREAIVPLAGANSLVSSRAVWAVRALASALNTEASAEAMLDGDGVVVVCVVWVLEPPPPVPLEEPPPPPVPLEEPPPPPVPLEEPPVRLAVVPVPPEELPFSTAVS
jgi:hypothetical protein